MKVTFGILALAALGSASSLEQPAKRGYLVCPAKSSYKGGNAKPVVAEPAYPTKAAPSKPAYTPAPQPSKALAPSTIVCPTSGGQTLASSGSCKCNYQVNCASRADVLATSLFWERTSGEIINSLAECVKICDDNAKCEAVIWVNDPAAKTERPQDYLHCWQTAGLGKIIGSGAPNYGQISYKGSCSGSCSSSYQNLKKQ